MLSLGSLVDGWRCVVAAKVDPAEPGLVPLAIVADAVTADRLCRLLDHADDDSG